MTSKLFRYALLLSLFIGIGSAVTIFYNESVLQNTIGSLLGEQNTAELFDSSELLKIKVSMLLEEQDDILEKILNTSNAQLLDNSYENKFEKCNTKAIQSMIDWSKIEPSSSSYRPSLPLKSPNSFSLNSSRVQYYFDQIENELSVLKNSKKASCKKLVFILQSVIKEESEAQKRNVEMRRLCAHAHYLMAKMHMGCFLPLFHAHPNSITATKLSIAYGFSKELVYELDWIVELISSIENDITLGVSVENAKNYLRLQFNAPLAMFHLKQAAIRAHPPSQSLLSHFMMHALRVGIDSNNSSSSSAATREEEKNYFLLKSELDNWVRAAHESGSPSATLLLSRFSWSGLWTKPKNCEIAKNLYFELAEACVWKSQLLAPMPHRIQYETTFVRKSFNLDIVEYFKYRSESGDPDARYTMGRVYLRGILGISRDYKKAFYEFLQSNDPRSYSIMGYMLQHGYGVNANVSKALECYELAKNHSDTLLYRALLTFQINSLDAIKLLEKAAHEGSGHAMALLARFYYYGEHLLPVNHATAFKWLKMANLNHNIYSDHLLCKYLSCDNSMILFHRIFHYHFYESLLIRARELQEIDEQVSLLSYIIVSNFGDNSAFVKVAEILETKGIKNFFNYKDLILLSNFDKNQLKLINAYSSLVLTNPNDQEILKWESKMTLLQNMSLALDRLANSHRKHQTIKEIERQLNIIEYYSEAAKFNSIVGNLKMGDIYYYGLGVDRDYNVSAQFYTYAADRNDTQAKFNLGYMHQYGIGISKDYNLAKKYYSLAADEEPFPAKLALLYFSLNFFSQPELLWSDRILIVSILLLPLVYFVKRRLEKLVEKFSNNQPN